MIIRIALVLIAGLCASAADFTGRWIGRIENGPALSFELHQKGEALIGVGIFKGGGPVLFTGTTRENHAHFEINVQIHAAGDLTLNGDRITGTVVEGSHGSVSIALDRIDPGARPTGIEGNWSGTVTEQSKPSVPAGLFLLQSGKGLLGIIRMDDIEQAINASLDGEQLKLDVEGLSGVLTWKADKLSGKGSSYQDPDKYDFNFSRAAATPGTGLTGRWAGVTRPLSDSGSTGKPFILILEQKGSQVSGYIRSGPDPVKLESAVLEGKKLRFDGTPAGLGGRKLHMELELVNDYQLEGEGAELSGREVRDRAGISAVKRFE